MQKERVESTKRVQLNFIRVRNDDEAEIDFDLGVLMISLTRLLFGVFNKSSMLL